MYTAAPDTAFNLTSIVVDLRLISARLARQCCQALVLLAGVSMLSACITLPGQQADFDPQLINGERAFGEEVLLSEAGDAQLTELSPDMKVYLHNTVGDTKLAVSKFRRLFAGLNDDGYFSSAYDANKTFNAADTFANKAGNCLSYTAMFVSMARAAGMDARFQIVKVPPTWDADSGYLIRYTHINVLVSGVRMDKLGGGDFTVDFNAVHPEPEYTRRIVSDRYAESLFHANRSVTALRQGNDRLGLAHLRAAIELEPNNPDMWINLGAFYGKLDNFQAAIDAYSIALDLDYGNKSAYSGLARAYSGIGDQEMAGFYLAKVKRYRDKNPYYHFALAQAEYEDSDYSGALSAINVAIDLKRRNGRFYFMKGLTQQKLGDFDSARKSFKRAERYGHYRDLKRRYVNELAGNYTAPGG